MNAVVLLYSVMQYLISCSCRRRLICAQICRLFFLTTTSSFASFSAYVLCCLVAMNLIVGNALPTEKFGKLLSQKSLTRGRIDRFSARNSTNAENICFCYLFISGDSELWHMTLTFKLDLDVDKVSHLYLAERFYFVRKLFSGQTNTAPPALAVSK